VPIGIGLRRIIRNGLHEDLAIRQERAGRLGTSA